ncbi:sulfotransferase [Ferrovibrio terrae]|uniref:sulfotransferase family protein n=1 Tax=Ferrovibrio terrae TaxID=2594003 RepID=UPI003137B746
MQFSGLTDLPFEPYFVTGAPRTGTSVLHALICTDDAVNDYINECSYFTALLQPFMVGWKTFDDHTKAYFGDSRQRFIDYHGQLIRGVLHDTWEQLGKPKKLVLKDPVLSRSMHLSAQLVPTSKYIITIRDPRDVMASRVVVMRKTDANAVIGDRDIEKICKEFNASYTALINMGDIFAGRALLVPYEALAQSGNMKSIEDFMGIAVRKDRVWQSELTDVSRAEGNAWNTEQYGKPLNADSVGNYRKLLDEAQVALVEKLCAPQMQALGVPLV